MNTRAPIVRLAGFPKYEPPCTSAGSPQPGLSSGAGESSGGVQEAVANEFGFGAGQLVVESDEAGPGEQVTGDERGGEPRRVDGHPGRAGGVRVRVRPAVGGPATGQERSVVDSAWGR